jgi:hypothetical protein
MEIHDGPPEFRGPETGARGSGNADNHARIRLNDAPLTAPAYPITHIPAY